MANGQMINKSCALCHGAHGQGASGKLSPRIAGLPKEYIIKAMKDYVDGKRVYPLMVRTSQIDKFTERDYEDSNLPGLARPELGRDVQRQVHVW